MIALIAFLTFLSTFLGGLFALRFSDRLHLILGFSAGAVLGVAFFDLLPEAISLGAARFEPAFILSVVAAGFVAYMFLDRLFIAHCREGEESGGCLNKNHRGRLGAGSLSFHSFLDGAAIGLAFKVSAAAGLVVTAAVLVHDFSDGVNTVGLILKAGGRKREALGWLSLDAAAPVLGVVSTFLFSVSEVMLGLLLALFGGFFLYIGASELLPESHHRHPTLWTTLTTVLGIAVLYLAVCLAGF